MKTSVTASSDPSSDSFVDPHPPHSPSLNPPAPAPDASTLSGNAPVHPVVVSRGDVQSPHALLFLRAAFRSAFHVCVNMFSMQQIE